MGRLIIILITLISIIAIVSNKDNNIRVIANIKKKIKDINLCYLKIFKGKAKLTRLVQGIFFIVAEIMTMISISKTTIKLLNNKFGNIKISVDIMIIIAIVIIMYFIIGYILLILTGIHLLISNLENIKLKSNLLISYLIISTYFFILITSPEQYKESSVVVLIGLAISYYLNMNVLIKLIKNPLEIKGKIISKRDGKVINRRGVASILILIMIIINLFLAVSEINYSIPGSFSNSKTSFDLFYYTMITFTTVGYGDIVPLTVEAKIIAIIISVTSVICLTVFLSSVLSIKEDEIEK